ncbi:hypothetical protein AURDEDRAFT_117055 [Auricularia subglabra TFB-10046 SS5]|nr:hypothetical protein AURDEDRAFT_117055 [Auricularia subglabra TFB-10046 SS5]
MRLRQLRDLTLAHLLAGDTCPPISIAEFEAYLAFQENALQHLQFVVWFQDYTKRFFALPPHVRHLAPGPPDEVFERARNLKPLLIHVHEDRVSDEEGALCPQDAPSAEEAKDRIIRELLPVVDASGEVLRDSWGSARALVQPFRDECLHIAQTFFKPGSPKELRVDAEISATVFTRLRKTTHPDVFLSAYERIYNDLESTALPNFILIETTNINVTKQILWYCLGIVHITIALCVLFVGIFAIPDTPGTNRAWRTFAVPFMFVGLTQAYMAVNGVCRRIWKRGGTQLRTWELQALETAPAEAQGRLKAIPAPQHLEDRKIVPANMLPATVATSVPRATATKSYVDKVLPEIPDDVVVVDLPHWDDDDVTSPSDSEHDEESQYAGRLKAPYSPELSQYSPQPLLPKSPSYDSETRPRKLRRLSHVPTAIGQLRNGLRRPPIFGPEKVVLDTRIRAVHRRILRGLLVCGVIGTLIFCIPLYAIPGVKH